MFRLVDAVARSWYVVTHGISYNIYRISCKEKDTAIAGVQCSMFRLAIDWDSPCTGTICKSANERKQTINHGNWNDRKEERKIERDCAMTHVYFCSLYYMTWHGIIFPRLTCLTLLSKTFLICRIWIEVLFCLAKYDSFSYSTNNDNDDVKWHVEAQHKQKWQQHQHQQQKQYTWIAWPPKRKRTQCKSSESNWWRDSETPCLECELWVLSVRVSYVFHFILCKFITTDWAQWNQAIESKEKHK